MNIKRTVNLNELLNKKSHFLFGPRATGKSTLIREQLKENSIIIDLLKTNLYLRLLEKPYELEDIIKAEEGFNKKFVVIDEVQKIPLLLNEVHRLIEEENITFLLTGSSTKNLKKKGTNLLAGRAWTSHLYPLTWNEISNFNLKKYLTFGGLPAVFTSDHPEQELDAYVNAFLIEEIKAEGFVRKFAHFSKFLNFAAMTNSQVLNHTSLGSDAQISPNTIREYFQLLEDTLLGFNLKAWTKSKKRKVATTSKFYFFDLGVVNSLKSINVIQEKTELFGQMLEHFIILEAKAANSYLNLNLDLSFWRTRDKSEVDLILGDEIAIEVKSKTSTNLRDAKNLLKLKEEGIIKKFYLVSLDKVNRKADDILYIYWEDFLIKLWEGNL